MSWFADLAGKAETLLNKVDQGAATALSLNKSQDNSQADIFYPNSTSETLEAYPELQHSNTTVNYPAYAKTSYISSVADNIKQQKSTILAGTANVKPVSRTSTDAHLGTAGGASTPRPSTQFVRRKKSEPDDELLFDFLNSSEKASTGKADTKKEKSKEPVRESLSRSSSISSLSTGTPSIRTTGDSSPKILGNDIPFPELSDGAEPVLLDAQREVVSSSTGYSPSTSDDGKTHELSNLRLENQLLRNEVQSLNQEMATLLQRSKETQQVRSRVLFLSSPK